MRLSVTVAAVLCMFSAAVAGGAEGVPAAFEVSFETSLVKVFPVDTALAARAPRTASLSLAANEYEAFQTLVLARRDLEGVTVTASDLVSENGARIPALHVSINAIGYVPVIKPFYKPYYQRLPGQPVWPDPLLPEGHADVKAGTVQPFWVTVYAPPGTPPGDYKGTVSVSAEGVAPVDAPVEVHVWDFAVPAESHLRTCFWLYPRYIRQYYGFEDRADTAYAEILLKYYNDMLAHRMSHADITYDTPAPEVEIGEGVEPDFSEWDAYMQGWLDKGQNFFVVPIHRDDGRDLIILKARIWGRHLEEKGWLHLASAFMHDETTDGKNQRTWVHEGYPGLKNALTWHPVPECPEVDIWIPQVERGYAMYPESVEWARKHGKEIWIYSSSPQTGPEPAKTAFYPNTNIDFPGTHCRLLPWVCWREDFAGYLYWCVNHWEKNPWETAETFRNQNGNGSFFYPAKDGPVHSIRLKAFRDGMEDYEYFHLLRERADAAKENPAKAELVTEAQEVLRLWHDTRAFMEESNRNPLRLYEIRDRVARLIEQL
ncbi:MAG: DUF4091 domain-containing protein [Planctomycetota bacterium]